MTIINQGFIDSEISKLIIFSLLLFHQFPQQCKFLIPIYPVELLFLKRPKPRMPLEHVSCAPAAHPTHLRLHGCCSSPSVVLLLGNGGGGELAAAQLQDMKWDVCP